MSQTIIQVVRTVQIVNKITILDTEERTSQTCVSTWSISPGQKYVHREDQPNFKRYFSVFVLQSVWRSSICSYFAKFSHPALKKDVLQVSSSSFMSCCPVITAVWTWGFNGCGKATLYSLEFTISKLIGNFLIHSFKVSQFRWDNFANI